MVLDMALEFHASVEAGLKLKVKKFWGLILSFREVTVEKKGREELFAAHSILNRVKLTFLADTEFLSSFVMQSRQSELKLTFIIHLF